MCEWEVRRSRARAAWDARHARTAWDAGHAWYALTTWDDARYDARGYAGNAGCHARYDARSTGYDAERYARYDAWYARGHAGNARGYADASCDAHARCHADGALTSLTRE